MSAKTLTRRQMLKSAGALAAGAILAACSPSPTAEPKSAPAAATAQPTAAPAPKQAVEVVLWDNTLGGSGQPAMQAIVNKFNKENADVVIKWTPYNNEEYKSKILSTAFAGGQPPDVFGSPGFEWLFQYAKAGELTDITSWYKERQARFTPGLESVFEFQGKVYAAPFTLGATGFIYFNKKLLADNGLSIANLNTFEEWLDACEKLKAKGIVPIAFGNKNKYPAVHWTSNTIKTIMGADKAYDFFTLKSGKWSDPETIEGLKAFMTFIEKGYFNVGAATEDAKIAQDSFMAGKMAMYLGGNSVVQVLAKPDVAIEGDFVEFPAMKGKSGKPSDWVFWANSFGIAKKTKNLAASQKVLDAIASGPYQRVAYDAAPQFYAAKDALTGATVHPIIKKLIDLYGKTTRLLPIPDLTLPLAAAAVQYDELAGMVSKQVTVEKAAANIDAAIAKERGA